MDLDILNAANRLRLPQFKNKHGDAAHSQPDGSDWSPRMWLIAMMGEVGELADESHDGANAERIGNEAADVLTYLDLYCQRALDKPSEGFRIGVSPGLSTEVMLLDCIMSLGSMCEAHKKWVRGDMTRVEYIGRMQQFSITLARYALMIGNGETVTHPWIGEAHPHGVNLCDATVKKFNEVSRRVDSDVFIGPSGISRVDLGN